VTAQPELGRSLRALRISSGRSLTDVGEEAGISASFLSMVEKGTSDISIGRLLRLTQCYGVEIADVLPRTERRASDVIRVEEHQRLTSEQEHLEMELLADASCPIRPSVVRFQPGAKTVDYVRDAGDAFLYVFEGAIVVDVGREEPIVLNEGDSAYLPAELPRRYENRTGKPVSLLSVVLRQDALRVTTKARRRTVAVGSTEWD
jgi:transcriptional regulator with XRE-family HTH domain